MNKDNFYLVLTAILIAIIIFFSWKTNKVNQEAAEQADELKKTILALDTLVKESDGKYSKLVDNYYKEKDLRSELKSSNAALAKEIKNQNERLLSLTTAVISLEGKYDSGRVERNPDDTSQIKLALKYPNDASPFIRWNGIIDSKSSRYEGQWSFGKLPIQIILTEESRGFWKNRIIGPEWFIIDSLQINSLPPEKYVPTAEKKVQFLVGGDYMRSPTGNPWGAVGVGAGVSISNKHNLLFRANTNQELGVGYYYKIKTLKKNR